MSKPTPEKKKEILTHPSIQSWLSEFPKNATIKQYRSRICKFLIAVNKKPEDILTMDKKEVKQLIIDYQIMKKNEGVPNNGILSIVTAFRSYLVSIDKEVTFRRGQLLNIEEDSDSHIFTNGDLKNMFDVGGAFEKALIATAVSEGWEISQFLDQSREKTEKMLEHAKQNNEEYIFWRETRDKTGKPRLGVLNPLAIEHLTKYLAVRREQEKKNPPKSIEEIQDKRYKIDYSDMLFPITSDGVQKMLYRLAREANLAVTGKVRFHNIRKWLMSRLSRSNFNEFQIKFIMGKGIPVTDSTYLQTLQEEIEGKYPKVYNDYLNINPILGSEVAKKQHEELLETKNELYKVIGQKQREFDLLKEAFAIMFKMSTSLDESKTTKENIKPMQENPSVKKDAERLNYIFNELKIDIKPKEA